MLRRTVLCAVVLLGLMISPAAAERRDLDWYSVEVPEGWAVQQEGDVDIFSSPDESFTIYIVSQRFSADAFDELRETWLDKGTPYKIMEAGRSFIFAEGERQEERGWLMLTEENVYLLFSVDGGGFDGLADFTASLKAAPGQPGLEKIFVALNAGPEILDWLSFITPPLDR